MKIFENITNGYRKVASGIAIVAFLTLMYFALIPGGTVSATGIINAMGDGIPDAFVKLVDYPQYNATTDPSGNYALNNVPYDAIAGGSTYTMRTRATGYALNTTTVFINGASASKNIELINGTKFLAAGQQFFGQWKTEFRVGNLGTQSTTLDTNFLNGASVTKNNSEDVIQKMTSRNYKWSEWVTIPHGDLDGTGTVTSEQPIDVFTMQRSDLGGKLGFFDGAPLNSAGTEWLVPGQTFIGQWRTGFKVLNLGDTTASVNMKFYNNLGAQINDITVSIPAKTSPYYDWNTYGLIASGNSPDAVAGTAKVTSITGQPLSISASQASEANGKLGFWNGIYLNDQKTDVFVTGMIHQGQWRSGFKVANLGTSPADVTIYFYDNLGALINTVNTNIPANGNPYYDWLTYGLTASGNAPDAVAGTARVVSNGPNFMPLYVVESQASETPGILDFYQAAEINGNTTAGLIYLEFQNGERSGFKIANPSQTTPVSVTIKFYNATGTLVNTISDSVAAKASPYYAWNAYTTAPSGTVTVEASGRISVVASIASETEGKLGIYKGIKQY